MLTFLGKRKALHRAAFNAAASDARHGVSLGGPLRLRGPAFALCIHGYRNGIDVPEILAAGAACFVVCYVLVTVAIALHSREPLSQTLLRSLPYQAFVSLVLFATAPLVAVVIGHRSAALVLLFAFPLAAIYVNAAISVQREHQAHHDELTGLANRKLLMRRLDSMLTQAAASGQQGRVPAARP